MAEQKEQSRIINESSHQVSSVTPLEFIHTRIKFIHIRTVTSQSHSKSSRSSSSSRRLVHCSWFYTESLCAEEGVIHRDISINLTLPLSKFTSLKMIINPSCKHARRRTARTWKCTDPAGSISWWILPRPSGRKNCPACKLSLSYRWRWTLVGVFTGTRGDSCCLIANPSPSQNQCFSMSVHPQPKINALLSHLFSF